MVDVLIVTYGSRWTYLKQVLDHVYHYTDVTRIVVVDNHASNPVDKQLSGFGNKIVCITLDRNTGSAGGFGAGLKYILENQPSEYVWLLDDDNLPEPDALKHLMHEHKMLTLEYPNTKIALMCLRPDRRYLKRIADGESVSKVFPLKNSFFGFHIGSLIDQVLRRMNFKATHIAEYPYKLPYAPYGGLFCKSTLLEQIGLPDERYFIYADDFEYTHRIVRAGGYIYLIPASVVQDLEKSWINKRVNKLLSSRFLDQNDFRGYLSARNTIHFQYHHTVTNKMIFTVNQCLYTSYIFLLSLLTFKFSRFLMFATAVREGKHGIFRNEKYISENS